MSPGARRVLCAAATAITWSAAVIVATWALIRALGLEGGYPLYPLLAFTPHVAAVSIAVLLICLILRRRGPAVLAAAAAVALVAATAPRLVANTTEEGAPLRVMSANMRVGEGDPEHLAALVRDREVDVLSVQELTPELADGLREAGLERELPHVVLAAAPQSDGGGIYSRLPFSELSEVPDSLAGPLPAVEIRVPAVADPVRVYDFHPPPPTGSEEVANLTEDLRSVPAALHEGPLAVVAGDFNSTLDHEAMRDVVARGYHDAAERAGKGLIATWPVGRRFPPQVTIDHVLADERIGVASFSVHDLAGSDHRAVLADLRLPAGG